jgi:plasmid stabilization system protein ParE
MYEIRVTPQAEEDLRQLTRADRHLADRILTKLETLAERPYQGKPLVGPHAGRRSLSRGLPSRGNATVGHHSHSQTSPPRLLNDSQ